MQYHIYHFIHTILWTRSMYRVHIFNLKSVIQNIHFWRVCTGTHSVHTRYILEGNSMYSVHTWGKKYVPGIKSMYQVHTGLCRFITVPYYSMVHTGSYSVNIGMNLVHWHTTGHDSRWLKLQWWSEGGKLVIVMCKFWLQILAHLCAESVDCVRKQVSWCVGGTGWEKKNACYSSYSSWI